MAQDSPKLEQAEHTADAAPPVAAEPMPTAAAAAQKMGTVTARGRTRRGKGLRLPRRFRKAEPGSAAGIDPHELPAPSVTPSPSQITCIDYAPDQVAFQEVRDLRAFIDTHRPEWSKVRWINVDGLEDLGVVRAFAEKYRLHPLAIEDVVHIPQRPKVQNYAEDGQYQARVFIVARMMELRDGQLHTEQISIFVGHKTVLTFQERPGGDVWGPIRQRLRTPGSQLRKNDASFLAYSLIDAMVDFAFPILEQFGDRLEDLEDLILQRPKPEAIHEIHRLKRELLLVRRSLWPMREVVLSLQREPHECFSDITRTYIRDVYEHVVQAIDIVETYREVATGLTETYMTAHGPAHERDHEAADGHRDDLHPADVPGRRLRDELQAPARAGVALRLPALLADLLRDRRHDDRLVPASRLALGFTKPPCCPSPRGKDPLLFGAFPALLALPLACPNGRERKSSRPLVRAAAREFTRYRTSRLLPVTAISACSRTSSPSVSCSSSITSGISVRMTLP